MEELKFNELMDIMIDIAVMTQKIKNTSVDYKYIPSCITTGIEDTGLPFENMCEIRNSKIHGLGVFAKNDIDENVVITMYPAHALRMHNTKEFIIDKNIVDKKNCVNNYSVNHNFNKEIDMIAGSPEIIKDYLLGHMINDFYDNVNELKDITDVLDYGKKHIKYLIQAQKNRNVVFIHKEHYIYVKTIRPIKKDEELFVSYEIQYWSKTFDFDCINKTIEFEKQFRNTLTPKQLNYYNNLYFNHMKYALENMK